MTKRHTANALYIARHMNRGGYLAGGMPEVIDLETEVPDSSSSYDSSDDNPATFFRQDKELQQSRPEMFQQKTYAPYTGLDDEPAPARQPSSRPMAYAPSDTPSRGPAMDAIDDVASSGWGSTPRPVPPGNIPDRPVTRNVDPRLVRILDAAGTTLPEGWSFDITSGHRPGSQGFHSSGNAVDVRLKDDQGRILPNYQNAGAFRAYEQFAQAARKAQLDLHPELSDQLRWGGYFSGPVGKYGAKDLMHFDLGGDRVPMGGGAWETGLHERERRYLPGAKSVGMGRYANGGSTDGISIVDAPEQSTEQLPDNAYAALYEPKMVRLAERQPQTDQPASINREYMPFEGVGSVNAGANAGPVRGNVSLSGQHGQTPSYGMNLGLDLPGDLVASYNRSGEAGGRSRDANNALSIAKRVGKGQVGVNTSKSGEAGPRSYGAQFQYPLGNKGGSAGLYADYTPSSKDLRGGVRFQRDFATGGAIADRAIMLLSKKAKRQPGRG